MLLNQEILEKYNLDKKLLNKIIRSKGKEWGLKKNKSGRFCWSKKAQNLLSKHLDELNSTEEKKSYSPRQSAKHTTKSAYLQKKSKQAATGSVDELLTALKADLHEKQNAAMGLLQQTMNRELEEVKASLARLERKIEEGKADHAASRRKIEEIKTYQVEGHRKISEIERQGVPSQHAIIPIVEGYESTENSSWQSNQGERDSYPPNFQRMGGGRAPDDYNPEAGMIATYGFRVQGVLSLAVSLTISYFVFITKGTSGAQNTYFLSWLGISLIIFSLHPILSSKDFYNNLALTNIRFPKTGLLGILIVCLGLEPLGAMRASLLGVCILISFYGYHCLFQKRLD